MISLSALGSAASASSYYSADNYYTEEQGHDASAWIGAGSEVLELTGRVDEQAFAAVLEGKLPNGDQIEARNGTHRPGIDLTFSAPKSVSLVGMLGNDPRVVAAMRDSVAATLAWTERNIIETRVWDGSRQVPEKTGKLVAATFLHDINRNAEPQLHIHAVIANATLASDGKWHAIRNDGLYTAQHAISAVHNAELRTRIEALGYETVQARNPIDGAFEIKGVSREAIEAFSTRTAEIREALAAGDRSSPKERELAALATRRGKEPEIDPAERMAGWRETAQSVGLDPSAIVSAAHERAARGQTMWSRVTAGFHGIGARGMAIAAKMGLTPRDGDPLVPERLGRLDPERFAAAQAVASAARELGEHEAAFSCHDLLRTALERLGPFSVAQIEERIDLLARNGALIAGERMMTTEQAVEMESRVIAAAERGRQQVTPIASGLEVSARLQQEARALGLRRLNPGQEQAGLAILSSTDRVHLVQGGAGVGKSAALAPVAAIARAEGRNVLALAHVGRIAREFGEKTHSPASTVDGFLAKYARVLDGTASAEKSEAARAELSGALIMVDEASQIGTDRLAKLIDLANRMNVGRLVLAGDIKQLPAIEAGKPFEQLQERGVAMSRVTENLRAQTPQMKALNSELEHGDVRGAFKVLAPATTEVAPGKIAETAAVRWASLPPEQRDRTLLLASGRAMRSEGNAAVQAVLKQRGEIGTDSIRINVLDRVTITREGARQLKGYQDGRIVAFGTNLTKQGFERGERGRVLGIRDAKVELLMPDGEIRQFDPDRLPRNLAADAVTIFQEKAIDLHAGDRIRWTHKDADRGLFNGDIARVVTVSPDRVTVTAKDGKTHDLTRNDPMLERLDLAYAINVHVAQGMTATDGIIMMSEREKALNSTQAFLVAVTRIAENASLIVDNSDKIERQVERNPGGKAAALEVAARAPAKPAPPVQRDHHPDLSLGLEL